MRSSFRNGEPKVEKQGLLDVADPSNYDFSKIKHVRSKIIISHVRKATTGDTSLLNTHPFQYKHWIFAHNGSVNRKCILDSMQGIYKNAIKGAKYMLSLFGVSDFRDLQERLKDAPTAVDSDGRSYFVNILRSSFEDLRKDILPEEILFRYDENIQSYARKINYKRELMEETSCIDLKV